MSRLIQPCNSRAILLYDQMNTANTKLEKKPSKDNFGAGLAMTWLVWILASGPSHLILDQGHPGTTKVQDTLILTRLGRLYLSLLAVFCLSPSPQLTSWQAHTTPTKYDVDK